MERNTPFSIRKIQIKSKNNGAILENEIVKDGKTVQRYWIEIK